MLGLFGLKGRVMRTTATLQCMVMMMQKTMWLGGVGMRGGGGGFRSLLVWQGPPGLH